VKPEGHPAKAVFDTEAEAWAAFNATFAKMAHPYKRCYFRQRPYAIQIAQEGPPPADWPDDHKWYYQPPEMVGKWYIRSRLMFA
jgi:hypothetical protein